MKTLIIIAEKSFFSHAFFVTSFRDNGKITSAHRKLWLDPSALFLGFPHSWSPRVITCHPSVVIFETKWGSRIRTPNIKFAQGPLAEGKWKIKRLNALNGHAVRWSFLFFLPVRIIINIKNILYEILSIMLSSHLCNISINSCFKFQRLLLKMYVEYIRNVKS